MLLAPLPFDYVVFLDPGDRVRRTRVHAQDRRARPTLPREARK
jgi:hypothetical protein